MGNGYCDSSCWILGLATSGFGAYRGLCDTYQYVPKEYLRRGVPILSIYRTQEVYFNLLLFLCCSEAETLPGSQVEVSFNSLIIDKYS